MNLPTPKPQEPSPQEPIPQEPSPQDARAKQLVQLLIDVNAKDLSALRVALTQHDAKAITHHAHRVLGATLVVQEKALALAAEALEEASCSQPPDWLRIDQLIQALALEMDAYRSRV